MWSRPEREKNPGGKTSADLDVMYEFGVGVMFESDRVLIVDCDAEVLTAEALFSKYFDRSFSLATVSEYCSDVVVIVMCVGFVGRHDATSVVSMCQPHGPAPMCRCDFPFIDTRLLPSIATLAAWPRNAQGPTSSAERNDRESSANTVDGA